MASVELFPCFGFEFLGMCEYNPQAPFSSYFTIGDAVAALAFTLAVQQFLKPIYQFRLRVMRIKFSSVVFAVFVGAFCTVVASAIPNIAFVGGTPLAYPINWEIVGGLIIGAAYFVVAWITLRPAVVTPRSVRNFTQAGAMLLSEATDQERSRFAKDVLSGRNIEKLTELSAEFDRAERHAIAIEFEKLKEQGREKEGFRGRLPITAFYAFARRKELEQARYAYNLLQLMSESDFCRVVVTRHSWRFLNAIIPVAEKNISAEAAHPFVQGVAWQALLQHDGMLAREDDYQGFGVTREFATEFFGNYKMSKFQPLNGINSIGTGVPSEGFVSRLNIASELMLAAELKHRGFWEGRSTSSLTHIYERVFRSITFVRAKDQQPDYLFELGSGVAQLSKTMTEALEDCDPKIYKLLFTSDVEKYRHDTLENIAQIVCESLTCISNDFSGVDDPAWSIAHQVLGGVFDRHGEVAVGFTPFQQIVAIKLVKQLKENMRGYYPTLSRVLLSFIGPYETKAPETPGSAYSILKDAVYSELKLLSELYENEPKKVEERLPPNVSYNHGSHSLTHTYRDGKKVQSKLTELPIQEVDLLDDKNLRKR